jgi:hypothetical protein
MHRRELYLPIMVSDPTRDFPITGENESSSFPGPSLHPQFAANDVMRITPSEILLLSILVIFVTERWFENSIYSILEPEVPALQTIYVPTRRHGTNYEWFDPGPRAVHTTQPITTHQSPSILSRAARGYKCSHKSVLFHPDRRTRALTKLAMTLPDVMEQQIGAPPMCLHRLATIEGLKVAI